MKKLREFSVCQNPNTVIECPDLNQQKLIQVKNFKNDGNGKRGWMFNRRKVKPREIHTIEHNVPLEKCFEDKSEQCDEYEINKYLQNDNNFYR
jgi:hypothetical protein